jgi:uncharacterized UPF0160 family protein
MTNQKNISGIINFNEHLAQNAEAFCQVFKNVETSRAVHILVHTGKFHPDDVLCVIGLEAYVRHLNQDVCVAIGRPNTDEIEYNDFDDETVRFILDIGGDVAVNHQFREMVLDHHQDYSREQFVPGTDVIHCAGSMLLEVILLDARRRYGETSRVVQRLLRLRELLLPVCAQDNGQFNHPCLKFGNPFSFIEVFNDLGADRDDQDRNFLSAVDAATPILMRMWKNTDGYVDELLDFKRHIEEDITNTGVLVIDDGRGAGMSFWAPYAEIHPELNFVVFPSNRGGFVVRTIPVDDSGQAFRCNIIKGLDGQTFIHPSGFMATYASMDTAMAAANASIAAMQEKE